jgi:amino acid transporter
MTSDTIPFAHTAPHLSRRFGLLHSAALTMSNMVGIGPFITIPVLMAALGGPQSTIGWFVALPVAIPDGMIWSELGAAIPGSGGSYLYLREGFGRQTTGEGDKNRTGSVFELGGGSFIPK